MKCSFHENRVAEEHKFLVAMDWLQIWEIFKLCQSWSELKMELLKKTLAEGFGEEKERGGRENERSGEEKLFAGECKKDAVKEEDGMAMAKQTGNHKSAHEDVEEDDDDDEKALMGLGLFGSVTQE